jgi:hypothetical protein
MSSQRRAPDDDESYALGDLELAPLPIRPSHKPREEPNFDEELTVVVPEVRVGPPDNDIDMGLAFSRGNQAHELRETDDDHGFGDPLVGPSLELDLPLDDPTLRRVSSQPPVRASLRGDEAARPSRPSDGTPRASVRGESVPRASGAPSGRAPHASGPEDDERAARSLADYGDPASGLGAARYVVHVARRLFSLYRERHAVEQRASAAASAYEQALTDLGRALLDDQAVRAHEGLRDRVLLVQTKQGELSKAEESTRAAREREDGELEALAHKKRALEGELAPYVEAERHAAHALQNSEADQKRKKAKLQRAEIELRALSRASLPPPPDRVQSIESERAAQQRELLEMEQSHAAATAAVARTRRELSLRRGSLDAIEREQEQKQSESRARSRGHEESVARAEHALSAALCGLAEAADAFGLAHAAADQVTGLRAREAELDQVVDLLARYDRALTLYDRDALLRGGAIWLAALIVLAIALRIL